MGTSASGGKAIKKILILDWLVSSFLRGKERES